VNGQLDKVKKVALVHGISAAIAVATGQWWVFLAPEVYYAARAAKKAR